MKYKEICLSVKNFAEMVASDNITEPSPCDTPVIDGDFVRTFISTPDFRKGQRHAFKILLEYLEAISEGKLTKSAWNKYYNQMDLDP